MALGARSVCSWRRKAAMLPFWIWMRMVPNKHVVIFGSSVSRRCHTRYVFVFRFPTIRSSYPTQFCIHFDFSFRSMLATTAKSWRWRSWSTGTWAPAIYLWTMLVWYRNCHYAKDSRQTLTALSMSMLSHISGYERGTWFAMNSSWIVSKFLICVSAQMVRVFIEDMIAKRRGHIVAIASMIAFYPTSRAVAYTTTKFAVKGFMEALNQEIREERYGIKTSTIFPHFVNTRKEMIEYVRDTIGYSRETRNGLTSPKCVSIQILFLFSFRFQFGFAWEDWPFDAKASGNSNRRCHTKRFQICVRARVLSRIGQTICVSSWRSNRESALPLDTWIENLFSLFILARCQRAGKTSSPKEWCRRSNARRNRPEEPNEILIYFYKNYLQ